MKNMDVLIDTNILIDWLQKREPYYEAAELVVKKIISGSINGHIAAHSLTNIFYVLRKRFSVNDRRKILLRLADIFQVQGLSTEMMVEAMHNLAFDDYEDCLQYECAKACHADYIITRNIKDFSGSEIPCITAEQLLNLY